MEIAEAGYISPDPGQDGLVYLNHGHHNPKPPEPEPALEPEM